MTHKFLYRLITLLAFGVMTTPAFSIENKPEQDSRIDVNKLKGKWHCKEHIQYMGYDGFSEIDADFKSNGIYIENTKLLLKKESIEANYRVESEAKWKFNQLNLVLDQNVLKSFVGDNPEVAQELELKKNLSDPNAVELKIKTLTDRSLVMNLMMFGEEMESISRICKR